jgi:hypothetical protein
MEETCKKIACLLNKSVTYGAKKYRNLLKESDVVDRNFVATVRMLPQAQEIANLQIMMNNAMASNPQLVMYLDPFKIVRIAKENVELAELYFRQAQKRFIKTEQENAANNSQQNAQIQQASMQAKAEGDAALLEKQTQAKERAIVIQGMFDLAKANIPVPVELRPLLAEMLQNVEMPLVMENDQIEKQMQQMQMEEMQQQQAAMQQQGGEGEQMEPQQGEEEEMSPEDQQMMEEQMMQEQMMAQQMQQ